MKVELAQLAGQDNGTAYNLQRALAAIVACARDTQLIVFPETHLMGFPSAETVADVAEPLDGPTVQAVLSAAKRVILPWSSAWPRTITASITTPRC